MFARRTRAKSFAAYEESEDIEQITSGIQSMALGDVTNRVGPPARKYSKNNANVTAPAGDFTVRRRAASVPRPMRSNNNTDHHSLASSFLGTVKGLKDNIKGVITHAFDKKKRNQFGMSVVFCVPTTVPLPSSLDRHEEEFIAANLSYMHSYQIRSVSCAFPPEKLRLRLFNFMFNCWAFKVLPAECYFIAVSLFNQYIITRSSMPDNELTESIILASLEIACKYETQNNLHYSLVEQFDIETMNKCEIQVLNVSNFELGRHTLMNFVRVMEGVINDDIGNNPDVWAFVKMLAFLVPYHSTLSEMKPSLVAGAIARIVCHLLRKPWTADCQLMTQHSAVEMKDALSNVVDIILTVKNDPKQYQVIVWFYEQYGVHFNWFREEDILEFVAT